MLEFNNIQKYYGSYLAIKVPLLSITNGIWWMKGENGSGKTTFLKMIAGLHPFTGDIILENKFSIKKHRKHFVRLVNYAEAEPLYPSFLTAKDLVELYCETNCGDLQQAEDLLKQLHVYDAYHQRLGSYSSGMIKKVSLVLAFIGHPKIILLDEPLITIDAKAVDTICRIINDKYKEGTSFIITSHQTLHKDQLQFSGTLIAENKTIYTTGI